MSKEFYHHDGYVKTMWADEDCDGFSGVCETIIENFAEQDDDTLKQAFARDELVTAAIIACEVLEDRYPNLKDDVDNGSVKLIELLDYYIGIIRKLHRRRNQ